MLKRPMLATPTTESDRKNLTYPLLASPKIDGIRALMVNGVLVSRTLKPIPNLYTQRLFQKASFEGLDGELVVGNPWDKNLMQQTMSGVMSRDGEPDVSWHVFDKWDEGGGFALRAIAAKSVVLNSAFVGAYTYNASRTITNKRPFQWVPHTLINDYDRLMDYEEYMVNIGYEGIMLRAPHGPYKQGRSTLREGYLMKVKRFEDGEAEVIGFKEQMRNDNEATTDARGYTKRSTHADGKTAADALGALSVRDLVTKVEFDVGTGFTAEQRKNLWEGRKYLIGKIVKYKHFPVGVKDLPRFPTFVGFRDRRDM